MSDERWVRRLPIMLLVLAAAIATVSTPSLGDAAADLWPTLGLAAVTTGWLLTPRPGPVHFVVRTVLAFALCWLNPFYAVFAYAGFIDVIDSLRGRWVYLGFAAVAITLAGSQSGGLPLTSVEQTAVFVGLAMLNGGLAYALSQLSQRTAERATELERVNAQLEQALEENAELHRTLLAQAREGGVQEERQRLARELHDTLAQSMAAIVTQLQAAREERDEDRRHSRLEQVTGIARDALVEARRSVLDLAPMPLDATPLGDAVGGLVSRWGDEHPVAVNLVVTGEPQALHPEVEAALLRIAQESLNNVAKHARAGRVGVTLSYLDDEVILDVRDDGVGFDLGSARGPERFGLRGMHQRAERLAGSLDIEAEAGRGTAVSVRLPALERGAA